MREIEGCMREREGWQRTTPSDWSEVAFIMAFCRRHSSFRDKWTSTVQVACVNGAGIRWMCMQLRSHVGVRARAAERERMAMQWVNLMKCVCVYAHRRVCVCGCVGEQKTQRWCGKPPLCPHAFSITPDANLHFLFQWWFSLHLAHCRQPLLVALYLSMCSPPPPLEGS